MKTLLLASMSLGLIASCTQGPEKPAVTIAHYSKQTYQINEVVNKLMAEPNVKVMHDMADGVENTRAIGCDAVGEECNVYYEFLNKVVDLTNDNDLSIKDREVLGGIQKRLQVEMKKSDAKIQAEWKEYINADKQK
jgi:hypothetical protein